jgi:hypothetical protein
MADGMRPPSDDEMKALAPGGSHLLRWPLEASPKRGPDLDELATRLPSIALVRIPDARDCLVAVAITRCAAPRPPKESSPLIGVRRRARPGSEQDRGGA